MHSIATRENACPQYLRSKLVGVVPIANDSGQYRGKRSIYGGRRNVRRTLYMATLVATRYNHTIQSYYQHLLAKGKPKKVALIACMRKLLSILNAMVKTKQKFSEKRLAVDKT